MFTALLLFSAIPPLLIPHALTYTALFVFLLGIAGSSFAVGVGFFSRWFPSQQQGIALGVYGLETQGNRWLCSSGR